MGRLAKSYQALYRSYTESVRVNAVDEATEALYVRLLTCSDDFGRYYGDPWDIATKALGRRFKANQVTEEEVERRILELERVGLLARYSVKGEAFLLLLDYQDPTADSRRRERFDGPPEGWEPPPPPDGTTLAPAGASPVPPHGTSECQPGANTAHLHSGPGQVGTLAPASTPASAAAANAREADLDKPPDPSPGQPGPGSVVAAAATASPENPKAPDAAGEPRDSRATAAASSLWAQHLAEHLAPSAAQRCIRRLTPLVGEHGREPVAGWLRGLVESWQASGDGTGLLVIRVEQDPFVHATRAAEDPHGEDPRYQRWKGLDREESEPEAAPYPPGLYMRLAVDDRQAHAELTKAGPQEILAALRKRYPEDPAWESFQEPAA